MPTNILMPALSPTMEEGTLSKWLKAEGDEITAGDLIAEIETDKATMEVEAVDEGTLGRILVSEGSEGVKVNTPIALLLEEGEDQSALDEAPATAAAGNGGAGSEERSAEAPATERTQAAAATPAPAAPQTSEGTRVFA